ncbi:uncharacterized protein [Nothobranchius furzeri]|uniref:uncharacterized protein n=1 Tax=Nothobranchius furzeri TaxID=105023 RepID=UPI00077CF275
MKLLGTVQKWLHLWCFFSIAVLHSVSAGGAYCAKTAQARAAALGLEYPGVHGAPDLSSPAHYVKQPSTFSYDQMAHTPHNMGVYSHHQPEESPFDMTYQQFHPRSSDGILPSHDAYMKVRGRSRTNPMLGVPTGQSPGMPESSFEEVYSHHQPEESPFDMTYQQFHPRSSDRILPSHDAYMKVRGRSRTNPMLGVPTGQSPGMPESSFEEVKPVPLSQLDLTTPQGYKEYDLDVDQSAPNRHGMPRRRPFWPLRWSHAIKGTLRKVAPSPHPKMS